MSAQPPGSIEIDCRSVHAKLLGAEPLLLLDCREPEEHRAANIPQAMLLPMSQLEARSGELEAHRDGEIIVHCHHGGRSLRVTHWLRARGFSNVKSMSGGIDQWAVEIDPKIPRY